MILLAEVCGEVAVGTLGRDFFFLCLKLGWVLTLGRRFSLFVSEVDPGSDSGAPIFPFCVRSSTNF